MKVLWYCNVLLPKAAEAAKIKGEINTAGWIEGFLNQIWSCLLYTSPSPRD